MTTLLEEGIIAAKQGQKRAARALFEQVLYADDQNERAWLWLGEVVETTAEQIACLEKVLAINPANKAAQAARQKLKGQTGSFNPAAAIHEVEPGLLKNTQRKPFKLNTPVSLPQPMAIHHQPTTAMPLIPGKESGGLADWQQAAAGSSAVANYNFENLPLLPILVLGTLSVTALGGIGMFILLALLT